MRLRTQELQRLVKASSERVDVVRRTKVLLAVAEGTEASGRELPPALLVSQTYATSRNHQVLFKKARTTAIVSS